MAGLGMELHEACSLGDVDLLEELLRTGKYDVNVRDAEFQNKTALHWAASRGFGDCVKVLLENGANGVVRMDMGWTPAHSAAETGKIQVLRGLHMGGIPVHKRDEYGDTPKRIAEVYGHVECLRYLEIAEKEREEKKLKTGKTGDDSDDDTSTR